jgi:dTDP-4-dehydrorhamnose 3,5-epimerase
MQIHGVEIIPLKKIEDERGAVMHMLRSDQANFKGFGEIYFSLTNPGIVKGWKLHKKITQSMCVPEGTIKIVIYDSRKESPSFGCIQTIVLGQENYSLLQLPPNIWYAFKAISVTHAIIANCINEPHLPAESETIPLITESIPFDWSKA